jgi:hypothetical protein
MKTNPKKLDMGMQISMDKKQHDELIESLKNIENKLDILIGIQKTIAPKPKIGQEENKVLKLCDKRNTIEDISVKTGKSANNVKVILSHLKDKGLIISTDRDNRVVYDKI